jgi:hypothetical protein
MNKFTAFSNHCKNLQFLSYNYNRKGFMQQALEFFKWCMEHKSNVWILWFSLVLVKNHLADRRFIDRHLVDRHFVDRHFVDRHFVDRHLVDRHLVDRHLVDRHLVDK